MEEKVLRTFEVIVVFIICLILFWISPLGRGIVNKYLYTTQKVDDATNYKTLKEVENTCRSMISSYESDKMMYEQYKNADTEEKKSWGEQAKIRANKTAITYNQYILKNSFVWKDNIPSDIKQELAIIE